MGFIIWKRVPALAFTVDNLIRCLHYELLISPDSFLLDHANVQGFTNRRDASQDKTERLPPSDHLCHYPRNLRIHRHQHRHLDLVLQTLREHIRGPSTNVILLSYPRSLCSHHRHQHVWSKRREH